MSADNGYVVSRLYKPQSHLYGVFHYFASSDDPPQSFTKERARFVSSDPVEAVLKAHEIERDSYTEYGVHVNSLVLEDIERRSK